eukprot:g4856.t1
MSEKTPLINSGGVDLLGINDEPFELKVRIQEARNLLQSKKSGSVDSYVQLTVGTEVQKTNVDKGTRDPSWGQQFHFGGTSKNSHLNLHGEVARNVKVSKIRARPKDRNKRLYKGQKVDARYKSRKAWLRATIIDVHDDNSVDLFFEPVKVIEIKVFDKSGIGSVHKDQLIGVYSVPISDVVKHEGMHSRKWYRLQSSPENGLVDSSGEILLTMHIGGQPPKWLRQEKRDFDLLELEKTTREDNANVLEVTITRAQHILGDLSNDSERAEDLAGKVHPQVIVTLDGCNADGVGTSKGLTRPFKKEKRSKKSASLLSTCEWHERFYFVCLSKTAVLNVSVFNAHGKVASSGKSKSGSQDASAETKLTRELGKLDPMSIGKFRGDDVKKAWYPLRGGAEGAQLNLGIRWFHDTESNDVVQNVVTSVDLDDEDKEGEVLDDSDDGLLGLDDEEKKAEAEAAEEEEKMLEEMMAMEVKEGEYQIQVHIIEVRDLKPQDPNGTADPVVYVNVAGQKKHTPVKQKQTSCVFDSVFFFDVKDMDRDQLESTLINIEVFDADTFSRNDFIGSFAIDLMQVYYNPHHELYRKWVGIADENAEHVRLEGYLKFSIICLGPGDTAYTHDISKEAEEEAIAEKDGISGMVMMSPKITRELVFLVITVHQAKNLPVMDFSRTIFGHTGIDPYVMVSFAGKTVIKTRVRSQRGANSEELNPIWNEELWIPVLMPSMSNRITVSVVDQDLMSKDEIVATMHLNFTRIKLHSFVGRWFNLYGAPAGVKGDAAKHMNKYPDEASTFRGKLLLSARVERDDVAEEGQEDVAHKKRAKALDEDEDVDSKSIPYIFRIFVVLGAEIPKIRHITGVSKMSIKVAVGSHELVTSKVENRRGFCEWGHVLMYPRDIMLPEDHLQVPDVCVYLMAGTEPISFCRVPAIDIMSKKNGGQAEWYQLQADPAVGSVKGNGIAGAVLLNIGLCSKKALDPPVLPDWEEHAAACRVKSPYQLRVHVYQGRNLPSSDDDGSLDPYLKIKFFTDSVKTRKKRCTRDPLWYQTFTFDVSLPPREYMPLVTITVWDYDKFSADDKCGHVWFCPTDERLIDDRPATARLPDPHWFPICHENGTPMPVGELLLSFQLLPKSSATLYLPDAPDILPDMKDAYVEVVALGLRNLQAASLTKRPTRPYLEIDCGSTSKNAILRTRPSNKPSANDPNFQQRLLLKARLPILPLYAPSLNMRVRDYKFGGLMNPVLGTCSVGLATKMPWSEFYKPPTVGHEMQHSHPYHSAPVNRKHNEVDAEETGGSKGDFMSFTPPEADVVEFATRSVGWVDGKATLPEVLEVIMNDHTCLKTIVESITGTASTFEETKDDDDADGETKVSPDKSKRKKRKSAFHTASSLNEGVRNEEKKASEGFQSNQSKTAKMAIELDALIEKHTKTVEEKCRRMLSEVEVDGIIYQRDLTTYLQDIQWAGKNKQSGVGNGSARARLKQKLQSSNRAKMSASQRQALKMVFIQFVDTHGTVYMPELLKAFNNDYVVVQEFDLENKHFEVDKTELAQFMRVMENIDSHPEHQLTWSEFLSYFGQSVHDIQTLLRLYSLPKHMRESHVGGANHAGSISARQAQMKKISSRMTDSQLGALKHVFHQFKKGSNGKGISIMDLLMAMRDDSAVKHLFDLNDMFEEIPDDESRRFNAILKKITDATQGDLKISWVEFMSYFGQNRYDFRTLMLVLPDTDVDSAKRTQSMMERNKEKRKSQAKKLRKRKGKKEKQKKGSEKGKKNEKKDDDDFSDESYDTISTDEMDLVDEGVVDLDGNLTTSDEELEYMIGRERYDQEVELYLGSTPFENYNIWSGNTNRKLFGIHLRDTTKKIGKFKGMVRVIMSKNEKSILPLKQLMQQKSMIVRVYVLMGHKIMPKDSGSNPSSDPYLKIKLGKTKLSDLKGKKSSWNKSFPYEERYLRSTLEPEFYRSYELKCKLPGSSQLKIECWDYDSITFDDIIGTTIIDLEDRWFNQDWQKLGLDFATDERYQPKPLNTRTLWTPSSSNPQGYLDMWVEILTPAEAVKYPMTNISKPPPEEFQLRMVVWKSKDVPNFDDLSSMSDLYVKSWMENPLVESTLSKIAKKFRFLRKKNRTAEAKEHHKAMKPQTTDTHWRAKRGKASWNWRFKFDIRLPCKFPYLHLQLWDKDIFKWNDCIAECTLHIGKYLNHAHKKMEIVNFFAPKPPKGLKRRTPKKVEAKKDEHGKIKKENPNSYKENREDARDTLNLLKSQLGLSEPKDGNWLPMYKHDFDTQENVYMGQLLVSMEVMPKAVAASRPVGFGRAEPNMNPYLPRPVGRFKFSWNPMYMCTELLGPALCFRSCCCCWCIIITVVCALMAPFGEIVIAFLKPWMQYTWFWCLVVGGVLFCACMCVACELHAKWRTHMDELEEQMREAEEARRRQIISEKAAMDEANALMSESDDEIIKADDGESSEEPMSDLEMDSDEDLDELNGDIKNPLLDPDYKDSGEMKTTVGIELANVHAIVDEKHRDEQLLL